MSEEGELQVLYKDIRQINNKTNQAIRIRGKILQRINQACQVLKQNPSDERSRRSLVINLERERGFLDIVRKGIKNGIKVLKATLRISKRYLDGDVKNEMLQMLQLLLDTMEFAKGKVKAIEKRIKKGEKLEKKDYAGQHLNEFMETLREEEAIDREIDLRLRGESNFMETRIEKLQKKLGIRFTGQSVSFGTLSGGVVGGVGGIVVATGGTVSIPVLIVAIIGVAYAGMKVVSKNIEAEEESRREESGQVFQ